MLIRTLRINSAALKPFTNARSIFTSSRLLDDSSSSSDEENNKPKSKPDQKEAARKLNELIQLMSKKEEPTKLASQVKIPKPREKTRVKAMNAKKQRELKAEEREKGKLGNQLAEAASKVAESLGGDTKKTELELLEIYLSRRKKSVKPEDGSTPSAESNLPLGDILSGMKVEKTEGVPREVSRAHQVRSMALGSTPEQFQRRPRRPVEHIKINLFNEQPFKYFDVDEIKAKNVTPVTLHTWDQLFQRDLKLAITHPPKNIFEQLIQWTEQGKLWRFPIDNEQDWNEERQYDFTDHIFLERWLEPWCPETGPIRYFMELVCVGLSKNPFLTVAEKKAHIFWYEHYFRSKNDLLIETGVGKVKDRPVSESATA